MSIPDLPTLRVQYADARAALRRSTDVFEMTKAACADNIVVRANGDLEKNADDRKRAVQAALIHDPDYLQALDALRVAEQQAEHLQALIDAQSDLRRRSEHRIRERGIHVTIKSPFPYFGGKSRIAALVWERFGRVSNFVEPFFGSGAVLLGCPWPGHTETVNDADGLLANFWRALRADPDAVAEYADYPVSELDLHARHRWLVAQRADVERLLADPDWYDAKRAGWWAWGISQWIGSGWCPSHASTADMGELPRQLPHVGNAGMGLHRALESHALRDYLRALADRLRRTRVVCGDFARVLSPSVTWRHGQTAVFLDPPYDVAQRAKVYAVESDAGHRARAWAIANGDNPLLRIALCGYEGEHIMPDGWKPIRWKAAGGYGSQGAGRGRENAAREVVWFSPHCLDFDALPMFAAEA